MKLTLHQSVLHKTLQELRRVVPSKASLPILSATLLEATETTITFFATDLFTGIKTSVPGHVETPGKVAIPAQAFGDIVALLSTGDVTLSLEENTLQISDTHSQITLQCFEGSDFPTFPEKTGESIAIEKKQFEEIIQLVSIATAKDDARPVLTSVLFQFKEKLEIVATDGFRLATLQYEGNSDISPLLIPAKSLVEVHRLFLKNKTDHIDLTISQEMKQVFCSMGETDIVIRLMEGEFPPYQKILPSSFEHQVLFDAASFEQSLKGALVFAREASNIVRITRQQEELIISAHSPSIGSYTNTIHIKGLQGGDFKVAFNATYLLEFLNSAKPEEVVMAVNGSLKPVLFRPANLETYRYIVMPFKVTDVEETATIK